ncbi:MAG: cell division protein FtsZ [Bacteroidales bacterium]|nr:cell division protein FtsZ [Candidatus Cryptobacteroides aphodequi]
MAEEFNNVTPIGWAVSDDTIKVIGVGGGGCNAVAHMYQQNMKGCSFIVCNTDSQVLLGSPVPTKIQLGLGLGAGTDPELGRKAALEKQDEIARVILDGNTQMLFITAGMGGGTGTGAAPVIARMAKEKGILTVAVVTMPFAHEGRDHRTKAIEGIGELMNNVDSLLIIENDKLPEVYGDLIAYKGFPMSDEVLATAVRSIIEIIKTRGFINVDFKDVQTMMRNSGMALMGCGLGKGKNRIKDAVKGAFESPLLLNFDLKTARKVLLNITLGTSDSSLTLTDLKNLLDKEIAAYTGGSNNFKTGIRFDENPDFGDAVSITAIATGYQLGSLFGRESDTGNIITIPSNFVYSKPEPTDDGNGISLGGGNEFQIGMDSFRSDASKGTFRYDADAPAELLADDPAYIQELEKTASITRTRK